MRVRARFSKLGKVRFTSHRDVARMWERALRRAQVPVAYTEGFSPRPKLHFGLALSTGFESLAEYIDIDLAEVPGRPVDVDRLPDLLSPCLPVGIDVQVAAPLAPGTPSLQQDVVACRWEVEVTGLGPAAAAAAVEALLATPTLPLPRERKGRTTTEDARPHLLGLSVGEPTAAGVELVTELSTQGRGMRVAEVVSALGGGANLLRARRTHQWIERDGAREEPLVLHEATSAPHAEARAS